MYPKQKLTQQSSKRFWVVLFGHHDFWYEELVSTMVIFVLRLRSDMGLEEIVELETELEKVQDEIRVSEQEVQTLNEETEQIQINMIEFLRRCSVQPEFPKGNSKSD